MDLDNSNELKDLEQEGQKRILTLLEKLKSKTDLSLNEKILLDSLLDRHCLEFYSIAKSWGFDILSEEGKRRIINILKPEDPNLFFEDLEIKIHGIELYCGFCGFKVKLSGTGRIPKKEDLPRKCPNCQRRTIWCTSSDKEIDFWAEYEKKRKEAIEERNTREAVEKFQRGEIDLDELRNSLFQQRRKTPSLAVRLVEFIEKNCPLFVDQTGDEYVAFYGSESLHVLPLRSRSVKKWLSLICYQKEGGAPSSEVLNQVVNVLSAKAEERVELNLRWAWHEDRLYCDLGRPDWKIVEITPQGWTLVPHSKPLFYRSPTMETLPTPEPAPAEEFVELLEPFFNCEEKYRPVLYSIPIAYCFPNVETGILNLIGKRGSGKTTTAEIIKSIVDPPGKGSGRGPWKDERDLAIIAKNNFLLFFDNFSKIGQEKADELCRLVTGGVFQTRRLYSDDDLATFCYRRGVVISSLTTPNERGDFLDRTIVLPLPVLKEKIDEKKFWKKFFEIRPRLFGAFLSVLSRTMAIMDQVREELREEKKHRLIDWHILLESASRALGFEPNECHDRILELLHRRGRIAIEEDSLGEVLLRFLKTKEMSKKETSEGEPEKGEKREEDKVVWKGTASQLLVELKTFAKGLEIEVRGTGFPGRPNTLMKRVRDLEEGLEAFGYKLLEKREGDLGERVKYFIRVEPRNLSHLQGSDSKKKKKTERVGNGSSVLPDRQQQGEKQPDDKTLTDDKAGKPDDKGKPSSAKNSPYHGRSDETDDKIPTQRGFDPDKDFLSPEGGGSGRNPLEKTNLATKIINLLPSEPKSLPTSFILQRFGISFEDLLEVLKEPIESGDLKITPTTICLSRRKILLAKRDLDNLTIEGKRLPPIKKGSIFTCSRKVADHLIEMNLVEEIGA